MQDEFNLKNEYQKSQLQEIDSAGEFLPARYENGEVIDEFIDEAPELIEPNDISNPKSEFFESEGGETEETTPKRSLKELFTKNAAALLVVGAVIIILFQALGLKMTGSEKELASELGDLETIFDPVLSSEESTAEGQKDYSALSEHFAKIYELMQKDWFTDVSSYVQQNEGAMLDALKDDSEVTLAYTKNGVLLWNDLADSGETPLMKVFYNDSFKALSDSGSAPWQFIFYAVDDFETNSGAGRIATLHGEEIDILQGSFTGIGSATDATYEEIYVYGESTDFDAFRAISGTVLGGHFVGEAYLFRFDLTDDKKVGAHRTIDLSAKSVELLNLSANGTLKLSEISYLTAADGDVFELFQVAANHYYLKEIDATNRSICVNMTLLDTTSGSVSYSSYPLKNGETNEFFSLTNELNVWE